MSIQTTPIDDKISDLGPFDVLCGRDKQSYNNIGNRRFRLMININLPKYLKCKSRSERSKMILALTFELQKYCGQLRFLKRVKGCNKNNFSSTLVVLDHKQIREKIVHALRDAASQHKIMKRKQAIERKMKLEFFSSSNRLIASYTNSIDKRNSNHQDLYDPRRSSMLVSQNEAAELENLSQPMELRFSEIFDCELPFSEIFNRIDPY